MSNHNIDYIENVLRNVWAFVLLNAIKEHPGELIGYYTNFPKFVEDQYDNKIIEINDLERIGLVKTIYDNLMRRRMYITRSGNYTLECWYNLVMNIHLKNRAGVEDQ